MTPPTPRSKHLGVWLDGARVADLEQGRRGVLRCRYTDDALERWQRNSPLLSCSLPLGSRPQDALAFARRAVDRLNAGIGKRRVPLAAAMPGGGTRTLDTRPLRRRCG